MDNFDKNLIFSYSRAQALDDGVLVDASEVAREAGFRFPVAMTRAVWETCVAVPAACPWQDERGRLWDVLMLLRVAARGSKSLDEVRFVVAVQNDGQSPRDIELKATCGPGDDAEPVLTIMLPEED